MIKRQKATEYDVIDGQQRLTTLTILLAVLSVKTHGEFSNALRVFINEPGNPVVKKSPSPRLLLRQKDREFFKQYIQDFAIEELSKRDAKQLETDSQRHIKENTEILCQLIDKFFEKKYKELQSFCSFIITKCFLVVVSTIDRESAIRIFSILNTRGMPLQTSDILKADIIEKIAEAERAAYSEKWENMEEKLGREDFESLFFHIRMIFVRTKAKGTILAEYNKEQLKSIPSQKMIDEVILPYGNAFETIRKASYKAQDSAEEVNRYLKWLLRINNSDWLPPAIMFLAKNETTPQKVLEFFQKFERLSAYLLLSAKNTNERIARYTELLRDIENTPNEVPSSIELTDKENKEFREILNGDIYNMTSPRRSYLILRMDSFVSDMAADYNQRKLTIEHVLPQTIAHGSEWERNWTPEEHDKWLHKIANLVPLNKNKNSKAQNYDFDLKKKIYFTGDNNTSSYALTSQVLSEQEWTRLVVEKRQKELLETMSEQWKLNE